MKKSDLESKFGIVVMIDALGVRNATIEESIHFIRNIQQLVKSLPDFMSSYVSDIEPQKLKKFEAKPPNLITFGDTIIFSWEMKLDELPDFFPMVGFFMSFLILEGLENKMAFRGAIAVGDYIQSGSTVLGPAIADAAAWYGCCEIIGVIATPRCGHFLSNLRPMEFLQYDIPLKDNKSKSFWTVAWPRHFVGSGFEENMLQIYYELIQKFPVPKGTEDKYFNTEKFVKSVLSEK